MPMIMFSTDYLPLVRNGGGRTMLCRRVQRRTRRREITRQTRRHNNTPSSPLPILLFSPYVMYRQLHRIIRSL